jgi:hypothetical protein
MNEATESADETRTATVTIGEIEDFGSNIYCRDVDKFQHVLLLAQETFDSLGIEPYNYVYIRPTVRDQRSGRHRDEEPPPVYALPFADGFSPDSDGPTALLKSSLQKDVLEETDSGHADIEVAPHETAREATRSREYIALRLPAFVETDLSTCYMNPTDLGESPWSEDQPIEVYNLQNGARIRLIVKTLDRIDRNHIAISNVVRQMLDRKSVDQVNRETIDTARVGVRTPVQAILPAPATRGIARSAWTKILSKFVGFKRINAEVRPGYDRDEERGIARVDEETQQLLGISEGDRLVVEWNGLKHPLRCLTPPAESPEIVANADSNSNSDADSIPDHNGSLSDRTDTDTRVNTTNEIYLPTTERRKTYACINDVVDIRRDMSYTAINRITLSVFGIIGVLVGGEPLFTRLYAWLGTLETPVPGGVLQDGGLALTVLAMSVFIIWLLLWPERQKVTR